MDGGLTITFISVAMFVGCFLLGFIPLLFRLSEVSVGFLIFSLLTFFSHDAAKTESNFILICSVYLYLCRHTLDCITALHVDNGLCSYEWAALLIVMEMWVWIPPISWNQVSIPQKSLQFVSILGAGLLCGTALAITIPEGVGLLQESWRGEQGAHLQPPPLNPFFIGCHANWSHIIHPTKLYTCVWLCLTWG